MTTDDPTPTDTLEFGEPAQPGRFRRRNLVVGLATVAVLAAAATGVALASTSGTPSPSPSGSSASPNPGTQKQEGVPGTGGRQRGPGGLHGGGFGGGFGGPGLAGPLGALHGEFVVPKQGGGYQTLVVQRGSVSSVSASTITVKSDDGFSATYAVNADALVNAARDGIGSIKKGDEVSVVAQQKSGNDTALQIGDFTRMQGLRDQFGPGRDRGQDRNGTAPNGTTPNGTPSPAPTGSTGSSSFGI
jgi:hypothetical protein